MRVYISTDMEGIAGTVSWAQDEGEWRPLVRELMTGETNAAIEGALEAGATRIVVNDSHDRMLNLLPDRLHPAAELIQGPFKPLSMVEGVQEGFDAAFFIGYHAMAGTGQAILDHTYSSRSVQWVRINGQEVGETAINAGVCGYFGVPVALVAGDQQACAQAEALLPGVRTVRVKEALGRISARSVHPEVARRRIGEAARDVVKALAGAKAAAASVTPSGTLPRPFRWPAPVELEIGLATTVMADVAQLLPMVDRIDGRTVRYRDDDYLRVFKTFRAILALAAYSAS